MLSRGRIMDTSFSMGVVTPLIQLGVLIAKKTYRIFFLNVSRIFQMENWLSQ